MITGNAAKALLASPVFTATVNEMSTQLQDLTFNTAINEIQKRQDLFLLHRALVTIVEMLKTSANLVPVIQDGENTPDETLDQEYVDLSNFPTED